MTRATSTVITPAADEAAPPAPQIAPPRSVPLGRTTACTALSVAALAGAAVGPAPAGPWSVAAVSALVVGWGGLPLHRAAWAALRRGTAAADVLPAAGVLAASAAAVASSSPGAVAAVAAGTTLLLAGRDATARVRGRVDAVLPPCPTAATEARRGAAALDRVAERAAGGVACLVLALAVATLGFWLGAGAGPTASFGAAAAVLLIACPRVAGGVASTALLAATGRALALGVLPRTPRMLERAARVDTVVLCRTGTVTTGVRRLRAVHAATDVDPDEALHLAGAVTAAAHDPHRARAVRGEPGRGGPAGEHATAGGHPIGAVVAAEARARFGTLPDVAEFDGHPGLGVRGVVSELRTDPDDEPRVIAHATLVGRPALLADHGITLPPELTEAVEQAHAAGRTAVAVSWDGVARAVLEVTDPVRPESGDAVRRLFELGIVPVLMTGDDAGAARGLAAVLGVDPGQVLAPTARHDRAAAVAALRAQGRTVAVLGGPEDAAALAAADVALVHPARDTGTTPGGTTPPDGITLLDDDPLTAVDALHLARRTVRTAQRGVTVAAAYHLIALPVAAAGLLPPLAAAALAAAYPAAAVLHAAALRRTRPLERPAAS